MISNIPKIIHLVFLSKTEKFPDIFSTCMIRIKKFHPKWEIKLYNEDDAQKIITEHLPELLPIYNAYSHYVQKADLFRVVLVYLYGGFYMDLDIVCLKPLDSLLHFRLILPEERFVTNQRKNILEKLDGIKIKYNLRLGNYMFGSMPKHEFWLYYFKEAIKKASLEIKCEGDILETTGPGLLTNVYHKYHKRFPEITLLRNLDRKCLTPNHNEISCHFGNFAAHMHTGTWRWMHTYSSKTVNNNKNTPNLVQSLKSINNKIKNTSKKKIYLVKNKTEINTLPYLLSIFKELNSFCLIATPELFYAKVIYIGRPISYINKINKDNYNILISTNEAISTNQAIGFTNKYFSSCFLLGRISKKIKSEIHIPTHEIKPFHLNLFRDLHNDIENINKFTIGIFVDSHNTIQLCNKVISKTTKKNNIKFKLFYSDKHLLRNNSIKNAIYIDLNNERLFSKKLNELSAFICLNNNIENIILAYSLLYLGIPLLIDGRTQDRVIRKYSMISDNNLDDADKIIRYSDRLKSNYNKYNRKALKASWDIEDKFSLEKFKHQIFTSVAE